MRMMETEIAARECSAMTSQIRWILLVVLCVGVLTGCGTKPTTATLRDQAHRAMWQERWTEAESLYGDLVSRRPGDWRAQYGYGVSAMHTGDLPAARQSLEIAHTLKPSNRDIALQLAETMYLQHDHDALFQFLGDRAEARKSSEDWLLLAEYALMSEDPDSARDFVAKAMVVDDASSVDPYLKAATLSEQMGDLDGAMRYLHTGWQVDPTNEDLEARLRAYGLVPGPTLAMPSSDLP
jgi:thioredoxin-like negative regulator of GroEL